MTVTNPGGSQFISVAPASGVTIVFVFVKGANAYNLYAGDLLGLHSPLNNGGKIPVISHWGVCYDTSGVGTTTTTTQGTTTTTQGTTTTTQGTTTTTQGTTTTTQGTTTTTVDCYAQQCEPDGAGQSDVNAAIGGLLISSPTGAPSTRAVTTHDGLQIMGMILIAAGVAISTVQSRRLRTATI